MRYKHIIFDIDGTMLDSAHVDLSALQRALDETKNKKFEIAELDFVLGIPSEVALTRLGVDDVHVCAMLWARYIKEMSHTMHLFDGIRELIIELKNKQIELGIITSKNRNEYSNDFSPLGLDGYFDTVICVEDSPSPKPSPEPMYAYLNRAGATPEEVLYVGDTIYDMQCAGGPEVDFGLALWGCRSADNISPTYRFDSPAHLLDVL